MNWEQLISTKRVGLEGIQFENRDDRSIFIRDYDRLIFSAPFRRLQNKTQVFPLPGSVFVHNRLTHSLEVSCVGRSLGNGVAKVLLERHPELKNSLIGEIGNIVSAACLAHDMGNPPFGHSGEKAIASFFTEGKGLALKDNFKDNPLEWSDITNFEGNANSFRLLTHKFLGRRTGGFALTYPTLAAIIKYPYSSYYAELNQDHKHKLGFFESEKENFIKITDELGMIKLSKENEPLRYCRHPLVYLVEAADDICYEVMDIEDSHKLKVLSTSEAKDIMMKFFDKEEQNHINEICSVVSDTNEQIAYLRSKLIGLLINECIQVFVENEQAILDGKFQGSLIEHISPKQRDAYCNSSAISYERIYRAKEVLDVELAGVKIIYTLLDLMVDAILNPEKAYSKLLINRVSSQYEINSPVLYERLMAVLDYISGMTDVFAVDLYRKINGTSLPAV